MGGGARSDHFGQQLRLCELREDEAAAVAVADHVWIAVCKGQHVREPVEADEDAAELLV